jgi:hypothetical protein
VLPPPALAVCRSTFDTLLRHRSGISVNGASVIVGPSAVGDGGVGVESQASLVGVGAECSGNLGPVVAVGAHVVNQLRQPPFGLLDEAGDKGNRVQVIAKHDTATLGQRADGVVDEVSALPSANRRIKSEPCCEAHTGQTHRPGWGIT